MKPPPRPAKTRAIAAVTTPQLKPKLAKGKDDFEKHFHGDVSTSSGPDDESHSEYEGEKPKKVGRGRAKKKTARKNKTTKKRKTSIPRPPEPLMNEMSDVEVEEPRDDDLPLFERPPKRRKRAVKTTIYPQNIRIEVPEGISTINLNLGDLINPQRSQVQVQSPRFDLEGDTLLEPGEDEAEPRATNDIVPQDAAAQTTSHLLRRSPERACFLDLEPQLRNRVYRMVLKTKEYVQFYSEQNQSRTSALLRTSKQVNQEARGILYGENSFHFHRIIKSRGVYWEKSWREIGYKDARRFLEEIGPENRASLRYISIDFSDAAPYLTKELTSAERRFVNDPVVMHMLRLIGLSGAVLDRFVVGFTGRQNVTIHDVLFLRALTSIKCRKFESTSTYGHPRITNDVLAKIEEFMERHIGEEDNIDETRRKALVRMKHEKPEKDNFNKFDW